MAPTLITALVIRYCLCVAFIVIGIVTLSGGFGDGAREFRYSGIAAIIMGVLVMLGITAQFIRARRRWRAMVREIPHMGHCEWGRGRSVLPNAISGELTL